MQDSIVNIFNLQEVICDISKRLITRSQLVFSFCTARIISNDICNINEENYKFFKCKTILIPLFASLSQYTINKIFKTSVKK